LVKNLRSSLLPLALLLPLSLVWMPACKEQPDISSIARPVRMDPYMGKKIEAEILEARKQKDEALRSSSDSPLPPQLRLAFHGLEYYPIDWRFRLEGPVNKYPNPSNVQIVETDGKKRDALLYGYIQFPVGELQVRLQVYKLADQQNMLFIPFVDANGGKETYPAGRYLDLVEKDNGVYLIDFNMAYNPYCAYGGDYVCPVTPRENRIPVAIPAGEKILPLAAAMKTE
jgi:uncharacterized protein (DUF1684 family)